MKKNILVVSLLSTICLVGCSNKPLTADSQTTVKAEKLDNQYLLQQSFVFPDYTINKSRYMRLLEKPNDSNIMNSLTKHTKDNISFSVKDNFHIYNINYTINTSYQDYAKKHYPELLSTYSTKTNFIGKNNKISTIKGELTGINIIRDISQKVVYEGIPQNPDKTLFTEQADVSKLIYRIQSQLDSKYPNIFNVVRIDITPLN